MRPTQHLQEQLKQGDKELIGNKGYRKYLQVSSAEHFTIDEAKVKEEARYDGQWVLQTSLADEPIHCGVVGGASM